MSILYVVSMFCRSTFCHTHMEAQPNICFSKFFHLIHMKQQTLFSPQMQQILQTFIFFLPLMLGNFHDVLSSEVSADFYQDQQDLSGINFIIVWIKIRSNIS